MTIWIDKQNLRFPLHMPFIVFTLRVSIGVLYRDSEKYIFYVISSHNTESDRTRIIILAKQTYIDPEDCNRPISPTSKFLIITFEKVQNELTLKVCDPNYLIRVPNALF